MTPSYLQGAELQPWLGLLQITSSLCLQLFLPRLVFFFFSPVDSYFDALSERENHDKLLIYSLVAPTLH
jgi:hypothetical protein